MQAPPAEGSKPGGFALAVTFMMSGALCVFAPAYFDAAGLAKTGWHVVGVLLTIIGLAGLAVEVGRLSANETLSDFGTAFVLLVIALTAALAIETWSLRSPFTGLLRTLVAMCLVFAIYGTVLGFERSVRRWRAAQPASGRDHLRIGLLPLVVGILGVLTAIVNLIAVFQAVGQG